MKTHFQKLPFLFSIVMILVSVFVFTTLYLETVRNHTDSEEIISKWQTERDHRDEIKALERSVSMYSSERLQLESHFARSSDVVPFLDNMEELARTVNTDPEIISVEALKKPDRLEVKMSVAGEFESLHKFVMLLENSRYEIELTSVDLNLPGASNTSSNIGKDWELNLSFKLLSFVN